MQDMLGKAGTFARDKWDEYTADLDLPATKDQIVSHLRQKNAPDAVIGQFEKLPDRTYESKSDVAVSAAKAVL